MAKHTPGPWHRLPGEANSGHPIYENGRLVMRIVQAREPGDTTFIRVALVDSDNVHADARLIAAAPDLLEALEAVTDALALTHHKGETNTAVKKARAAIARATGESK